MKHNTILRVILWSLIGLSLIAAGLYCIPWVTSYETVFTCYVVKDGVPSENTVEIPVTAKFYHYLFRPEKTSISADLPEDSNLYFAPTEVDWYLPFPEGMEVSYYAIQSNYRDKENPDNIFAFIALSPEKNYMCMILHGTPQYLFVGSTQPDTDPKMIESYFYSFIRIYGST